MNFLNLKFHGNRNKKKVALTFDDGPSQETLKILNLLKKYRAKATFFLLGKNIIGKENVVRKIINHGHEIGNHSYLHKKLIFRTPYFIEGEIKKCDMLLWDKFRIKTSLFRPPYWKFALGCWIATIRQGKQVIFNDVVSEDWRLKGVDFAVSNVVKKTKNGSIINLHDYLEDIGRHKEIVEISKEVLKVLKKEGYDFVTVSEVLK